MYEQNASDELSLDFNRDVVCLFGMPVDRADMAATRSWVRSNACSRNGAVLATINVNWVIQCARDPAFRGAVRNSDFVVLDGKPLVWLARLLDYPTAEVVAGSTLIHELFLENDSRGPLSIYLFGGEPGIAEKAAARIDAESNGLRSAGFLSPGFGTIEEMSTDDIIGSINDAHPDILLVALGARKGTFWIEHNRERLRARTISHLGATINFIAGNVRRAPALFRKLGIEWIWRTLQEPKLAARYLSDGVALLRFLMTRIGAWGAYRLSERRSRNHFGDPIADRIDTDNEVCLRISRCARMTRAASVQKTFLECVVRRADVVIDFRDTLFVDGAFAGLLLVLDKQQRRSGTKLRLVNVSRRLARIFRLLGFEESFYSTNHA